MGGLTATVLATLAAALIGAAPAAAEPAGIGTLDPQAAYARSQDAIGRSTGAHVLRDQSGRPLELASFRGRPLVISLVFTSCSSICPVTTDHLRDSVLEARATLGPESFAVLTFGFDASGDHPGQLTAFAGTHGLRGIPDWYLASADSDTSAALLDELGFSWRNAAGGFDHITQTTIVDAEGRVYRQLYGEAFPLPVLVEPLKQLVLGTATRSLALGDLWDRIAFICTVYNPLTAAYRFDYGIFFGIFFGGLSLVLSGLVILRLWLGNRRAARERPRPAA